MLSETTITLLTQIPLAGVVVFVVVVFLKHLEKADTRNQKFICDQQESNNLVLKNLSNEIKEVGKKILALNKTMIRHDVKTELVLGIGKTQSKRERDNDPNR